MPNKRIILVLDGHPVHKAGLVKAFFAQQQGRLKLVYLPPYARYSIPTNRFGVTSNRVPPSKCQRIKSN
ncbi:transposase [Methylomonas rosea]|uniref:transposase n=1 Tax=Methylomonas rosea TaxID=2952227 RepID=UPI003531FDF2